MVYCNLTESCYTPKRRDRLEIYYSEVPVAANKRYQQFENMSKRRQRIEIAKDVLAQLLSGFLVPKTGVYLNLDFEFPVPNSSQLQAVLENVPSCTVCGIGGVFVCAVRKANDIMVSSIRSDWDSSYEIEARGEGIKDYLARFFSPTQVLQIEQAFERWTLSGRDNYRPNEYGVIQHQNRGGKAGHFAGDIPDAGTRMRLIMENIVANNGTFRPSIRPVQKTVYITPGYNPKSGMGLWGYPSR